MTCLGVLERGERGDDNGTCLKEGGLIEMSITVLHSRAAPSHFQFSQRTDNIGASLIVFSPEVSNRSRNGKVHCATN